VAPSRTHLLAPPERRGSGRPSEESSALLFEGDGARPVADWTERIPRLRRNSIFWVDLVAPAREDIERLAEQLELSPETVEHVASAEDGPGLGDHGRYLEVTALAPRGEGTRELTRVVCLVGERWVVTAHDGALDALDTFRERTQGSADVGRLEGLEFLATLLEWVLASYLTAFEEIELELERIDTLAMRNELDSPEDVLERLVVLRREIGQLRRALVSHRETILALTRPELESIASSRSAERFSALRERLEEGVQAARDSRDSAVGSFDVLIATTGQRTNEIVKVLTLASVLLLPGALVAAILGMNFQLGVFESTAYFWVVLAGIATIAGLTLAAARVRHWI
jgi:magnesium transporter